MKYECFDWSSVFEKFMRAKIISFVHCVCLERYSRTGCSMNRYEVRRQKEIFVYGPFYGGHWNVKTSDNGSLKCGY